MKISDNGQQRSEVYGNIESKPLIRPAEQLRHENQVCRAGNRQEFGQTLDERQDDGGKQFQFNSPVEDRARPYRMSDPEDSNLLPVHSKCNKSFSQTDPGPRDK